jgi:hypothetical protein
VEVDIHGIAKAKHCGVEVDLYGTRLTIARKELRPWETRADHEQGIALAHQVGRRVCAQQTDAAGDKRQVVRQYVLSQQGFGDARSQQIGDLDRLRSAAPRARPDQDSNLGPCIEQIGGTGKILRLGNDDRPCVAGPDRVNPCCCAGSSYGWSCTSLGRTTAVTSRAALAMRIARSVTWRSCAGPATS